MKSIYYLTFVILFFNNLNAQTDHLVDNKNSSRKLNNFIDDYFNGIKYTNTPRDTLNCFINYLRTEDMNQMDVQEVHDNRPREFVHCVDHIQDYYLCCKKIILISQRMRSGPATSEDARKYYIMGVTLMNDTSNKKEGDYYLAVEKFDKARLIAPWWNDVYKELALSLEYAQYYYSAITNFQLYLLTKPSKDEAQKVQEEIYKCEAMLEKEKSKENK